METIKYKIVSTSTKVTFWLKISSQVIHIRLFLGQKFVLSICTLDRWSDFCRETTCEQPILMEQSLRLPRLWALHVPLGVSWRQFRTLGIRHLNDSSLSRSWSNERPPRSFLMCRLPSKVLQWRVPCGSWKEVPQSHVQAFADWSAVRWDQRDLEVSLTVLIAHHLC